MATSATRGQAAAIDIGINEADRKQIAEGLSRLLADSYTLYLKTHNFHWNVTGPMFNTLHLMFEGQYTELAAAVDLIAERIRALGLPGARARTAEFGRLSSIQEAEGVPSANEMIAPAGQGPGGGGARRRARCSRSSSARTTSRPRTCSRSACRCTRRPPGCCARSSSSSARRRSARAQPARHLNGR